MDSQGAVVVVTGAARGVGRVIARTFAGQEAKVALVDVLAAQLERTAAEMKEAGAAVLPIVTDITVVSQVEAMADRVRRELGPVDILVNNAGTFSVIAGGTLPAGQRIDNGLADIDCHASAYPLIRSRSVDRFAWFNPFQLHSPRRSIAGRARSTGQWR